MRLLDLHVYGVGVSPKEMEVEDEEEAERWRKEEVNQNSASRKALSVILRCEDTKAVLDKRKLGNCTHLLLHGTVVEALHDRIAALGWDSAVRTQAPSAEQVFENAGPGVWYKPYIGIYIKLITMLGKCKQLEKAHELLT